MKTKEFKELKNKEVKDLTKMLNERKNSLRKIVLEIKTGSEKNIKKGSNIRKEIAKILTLIKEKNIINEITKEKGKEEK
jgi:ribosomal protein L29